LTKKGKVSKKLHKEYKNYKTLDLKERVRNNNNHKKNKMMFLLKAISFQDHAWDQL